MTGTFPIIKKLTRASCSLLQLYLFALFLISKVTLHHFPPLHLLIFVNTKLKRTIYCCIAISSVRLFLTMTKSLMTVCFIQSMHCVLAALLHGIFSSAAVIPWLFSALPWLLPSQLMAPGLQSSHYCCLGVKGWDNATSLFLFVCSCLYSSGLYYSWCHISHWYISMNSKSSSDFWPAWVENTFC